MFLRWFLGCAFFLSSFACLAMGPRARWETSPDVPGLRLAYSAEICRPLSLEHFPEDVFPVLQMHPSASGVTFATFASFERIANIRTNGACLVILSGYVKPKVERLGFESERIISTTITVKDIIQNCEEMRAVTLVNMSMDSDEFFSIPDAAPDVEVIEHHSVLANAVLYKIFEREGYLCRRLQVPVADRDAIYAQSGFKSVQFRAVRKPDDVPEAGLEVLKVPSRETLAEAAARLHAVRGGLGCFKSQNALYFRVRDNFIKTARETIYIDDERFSDFNIAAKSQLQYKIFGFPAGTSMKELVKTLEALNFVAIPSRIVNLKDLAIVFVSAPQPPDAFRYQTSVGMIQIVELEKRVFNRKENSMVAPAPSGQGRQSNAKGKGKGVATPPPPASSSLNLPRPVAPLLPNPYAGRVEALEAQMEAMKGDVDTLKKDNLDTKQKLSEISDNQNRGFRDLLEAISEIRASMPSSPSTFAHSPPSKVSPATKHQKV
ncbi:unnamed protein product [Symbiodinium natans]|uniref:Uncharacterized protein n=1 Tax=Symbiodinium natans TaxID=878477 RepID=A0A812MS07_9DINO|nr:unnamed protein product [Symbiodinium natans]